MMKAKPVTEKKQSKSAYSRSTAKKGKGEARDGIGE